MAKIFVSWHNSSHGIGFFKNTLAAFASEKIRINEIKRENSGRLANELNQSELENYFRHFPNADLPFDTVYYLFTDQKVINGVSTFFHGVVDHLNEDVLLTQKTKEIWRRLAERFKEKYWDTGKEAATYSANSGLLTEELDFVLDEFGLEAKKNYIESLWRLIHYYPVRDQIHWLEEYSNLPKNLLKKIRFVNLTPPPYEINDLRSHKTVAKGLKTWLRGNDERVIQPIDELYLNISYGHFTVQVAWFVLAGNGGFFPYQTYFLNIYDDKSDGRNNRFKNIVIEQAPVYLISEFSTEFTEPEDEVKSKPHLLAEKLLLDYLREVTPFGILLVGPRGLGKRKMVEWAAKSLTREVWVVGCDAFINDEQAERFIFGSRKKSGNHSEQGAFEKAAGGVLFFDKIHALSKPIQFRLFNSLVTDDEGHLQLKLPHLNGLLPIKCSLVFSSHLPIARLRNPEIGLLPELYDRISQFVIEIPPLYLRSEERENDWKCVWHNMKFGTPPDDPEFIDWLKRQSLPANYRDLEKLAINYKKFCSFIENKDEPNHQIILRHIKEKNPSEYAKNYYRKYQGKVDEEHLSAFPIDLDKHPNDLKDEFLATVAKLLVERYGSPEKAEDFLNKQFGDEKDKKITARTLRNWLDKAPNS